MRTEVCALAPADWTVKSLNDVCIRVTSGGTPSRTQPEYYRSGRWHWVKTQELQDGWIDHTSELITDEAVAKSSAKVLPANTVLVAMYGATVGQLGLLRRPMTCNQACCALVVNERLADYRFVFYSLLRVRSQLRGLATGAAQQNLSGTVIRELEFPFPELSEQRAIAHILGTLDDKIELNRRMSETLEEMARALFRTWFVDFDPVRAKMEARDSGLPTEIAELFPDRLVDSELGEIPEGWECGPLQALLSESTERVGALTVPEYSSTNDGLQLRSARYQKQLAASSATNKLIRKGNVVFGLSRAVLNFGVMRDDVGSVSPAYRVFRVDTDRIAPSCLESQMRMRPTYYFGLVSASSREGQSISLGSLAHICVVIPGAPVWAAYSRLTLPLIAQSRSLIQQADTLIELRDALLPKLISGELRVPDAERLLATAAV